MYDELSLDRTHRAELIELRNRRPRPVVRRTRRQVADRLRRFADQIEA